MNNEPRESLVGILVRWFVTVGDHLLLTQSPRSLRTALALTLVPVCLVFVVFRTELFRPEPFPNDGHAQVELDEALVARYCGRPASLSSTYHPGLLLKIGRASCRERV